MGPKLPGMLCNVCVAKDCESIIYTEVVDILLKLLNPAPNKFIGRVKLRKCFQRENESFQDFAVRLKNVRLFVRLLGMY